MRLKIYCVQIYGFYSKQHTCTPIFFAFLISHFRDELDSHQSDFLFGKFIAQFVKSIINLVCRRFLEVIIDIEHMIFIHNFFQEVVNIQFSSGVNDCFHFIQQFTKLDSFGKSDIVQRHFTVDSLNDSHLHL